MKQTKTKFKSRILACLLIFCLTLSFVACELAPTAKADSYAYIAIDINPSVEIVTNNGKVESVRACNDDASVLLSGEDLTGLTAEQATEKIVKLAEELGYLTDENNDVKLTVEADEDADELEEKIKKGAEKGSSRAIVNFNPRLADEREVKELKDENEELYKNLSPAKLRLIKSIMEYDPEMTIEIGVTMSIKDLLKLLDEYAKEFKDVVGEDLKKRFNERKEELKAEKKEEIAKIYGEDHLAIWTELQALKELAREIEQNAENIVIADEDVNSIITLLELEDATMISIDGVVTIKSVEMYIDRQIGEKFHEIKDQINEILDKYDEDNYALTEEELLEIATLTEEKIDALTLEGLEELIKELEAQLEQAKEDIPLTDEQKQQIEDINDDFGSLKDQAKEEFKKEMETAVQDFFNKKADKRK